MTFEELNSVRKLKKQLADENKKLEVLDIVIESFPHKYGKVNGGGGTSAKLPTSPFEGFATLKVDTEKKIENLQKQLRETIPKLTALIQENFTDTTEQSLLIYRYVACKRFKDISFLLGYSEQWIYKKHREILKSL